MPDVQEHEGRGAVRQQLYNADDEEELTVLLRRFLEAGDPRTACEEYLSAQEQTAKTGGSHD